MMQTMKAKKTNLLKFSEVANIMANALIEDASLFQQFLKQNPEIDVKFKAYKAINLTTLKLQHHGKRKKQQYS